MSQSLATRLVPMPINQVEQQWLVTDPSTLVNGRLVQGSAVYNTCSTLEKALVVQQRHPFSVILEIRFSQNGNQMFILNQGVVHPAETPE